MGNIPEQWSERSRSKQFAEFEYRDRGILVTISPRGSASKRRRRGKTPISFRVQLKQDWFAREDLGEKRLSASADSFEAAEDIAYRFMREFVEERRDIEDTHGTELEATVGEDAAAGLMDSEAGAEALTDAAGYSDALLMEVLEKAVGDSVQLVVHRADGRLEEVYRRDGVDLPPGWPTDFFGYFAIDRAAVAETFAGGDFDHALIDVGDLRVVRILGGADGETLIVLDEDVPVSSPSFERTLIGVLEEKWD